MIREILFRGKRLDNGEWVYGYPFISDTDGSAHILSGSRRVTIEYEVTLNSLEPYTGLTDKNGNKIFAGDIIAGNCNGKRRECFEIWWSSGNSGFVAGRGVRMRPNTNQTTIGAYEVAGNIHDNPELLEE